MSRPDDRGAYVSPNLPASLVGLSTYLNIPAAALAAIRGPLRLEQFEGVDVSSRTEKQLLFTATGGAAATFDQISPPPGDEVSFGLYNWSLTPDPVAAHGMTVRSDGLVYTDGFGEDLPTICAARILMAGPKPNAAGTNYQFCSFCGIGDFAGSTSDVTDGVDVFYDNSVGVDSWVLRSSRAGASTLSNGILAHDNAFHTVGFVHYGNRVVPFVDGVFLLGDAVTANLQPSTDCVAFFGRGRTQGAGADVLGYTCDWAIWGR